MSAVHGPGRCTECSFHVATQGHREVCSGAAPVSVDRDVSGYRISREELPPEMWAMAEYFAAIPPEVAS